MRWLLPVAIVAVLAVGGLAVLLWQLDSVAESLGVPDDKQLDIVRVYLLAVGGWLVIWQISIANRTAKTVSENNRLMARRDIAERVAKAIDHLGSPHSIVRIGGAYQLHHIARDEPEYRRTAFDLLNELVIRATATARERDIYLRMLATDVEHGGVYYAGAATDHETEFEENANTP